MRRPASARLRQSEAIQHLRAAVASAVCPELICPALCTTRCVFASSHLTQDQCPVPGAGQGQRVGSTPLGPKSHVWQVHARDRGLEGERPTLEHALASPYLHMLMDSMRLFGSRCAGTNSLAEYMAKLEHCCRQTRPRVLRRSTSCSTPIFGLKSLAETRGHSVQRVSAIILLYIEYTAGARV